MTPTQAQGAVARHLNLCHNLAELGDMASAVDGIAESLADGQEPAAYAQAMAPHAAEFAAVTRRAARTLTELAVAMDRASNIVWARWPGNGDPSPMDQERRTR